jgi:hypothetical protein
LAENEVPGPGAYDTVVPKKSGNRDFPNLQESESRAILGEMSEEVLAEM